MNVPNPPKARPNFTPASERTCTGERVSGGPTSTSLCSQESGAPLKEVKIRGIPAAASSVATCEFLVGIMGYDRIECVNAQLVHQLRQEVRD
jgi:hypothetical protein